MHSAWLSPLLQPVPALPAGQLRTVDQLRISEEPRGSRLEDGLDFRKRYLLRNRAKVNARRRARYAKRKALGNG